MRLNNLRSFPIQPAWWWAGAVPKAAINAAARRDCGSQPAWRVSQVNGDSTRMALLAALPACLPGRAPTPRLLFHGQAGKLRPRRRVARCGEPRSGETATKRRGLAKFHPALQQRLPALRVAEVARARRLVADPAYPSRPVLRKTAARLVRRLASARN